MPSEDLECVDPLANEQIETSDPFETLLRAADHQLGVDRRIDGVEDPLLRSDGREFDRRPRLKVHPDRGGIDDSVDPVDCLLGGGSDRQVG